MRNNITQLNYTQNRGTYQLSLPTNMEIMIPPEDSVRLLSQIMEELDYRKLYEAYSRTGRKAAVSPMNLFKIIVYGYMNGLYSSRAIEKACRRDINFMWLLQGQSPPDHNTIARFRTQRLAEVMEDLFSQRVVKLGQRGEIAYENLFIDGTKIEANANKYSFVWKKATTKHAARLQTKIDAFVLQTNQKYGCDFSTDSPLELIQVFFEKERKEKNIDFVSGKGTRKGSLQRDAETLNELVTRQDKYREYETTFRGRNSFSKTDEDATFMHMKEDHMRNSQLKPGYNVQIAVEAEYIVGIDISDERSDPLTLIPFLEKMKKNLVCKHKNVIADAGYESEENYAYLQEQQQGCYIKPTNYERSKSRKYKSNMHLRENMPYDQELDEYLCPNGKKLKSIGKTKRVSKSDYEAEITVYECESCEGCPLKSKCTKAKGNRRMSISKKFLSQREKSLQNIVSPLGILLRMNRSIQVEGAFGVLKEDYGFRRFLTRGKQKVGIEFLLLGMGYNINKLHHKIQQNRCGSLLHKMIA